MNWKRLLACITGSVDQELLLRNEFLVTENRILKNQIKGRLQLTDLERISLAEIGKRLGRMALAEVAQIVRPETILGWHRNLDIGSPKLAGSTRQVEGGWDLVAGGADIWEKSDQFHFLCKPISGDFELRLRYAIGEAS
jgi:hypothetical protein